jgi:Zn-dependent protease
MAVSRRRAEGLTFSLGGIPVTIEPGFLLITALFGYLGSRDLFWILEWIVVVGVSVLAHELGHAVAYRRFGAESRIVLSSFFGLTYGEALPPGRSIAVSLAGPFTGFVLGGLILAAASFARPTDPAIQQVLDDLLWINLAWGAINLLPILPLDGGHAAAALLERLGRPNAVREALVVSLATALLAAAAAVAIGQPWLLILLVFFTVANYDQFRYVGDFRRRDDVIAAANRVLRGEHDAGIAELTEIERQARSGAFRERAALVLAWSLLAAGRIDEARKVSPRAGRDPALESVVELAEGAPPERVAGELRRWSSVLPLAAVGRVLVEGRRLDEMLAEIARLEPTGPSRGLAALQAGLAAADLDPESARVGRLIEERGGTPASAWFLALTAKEPADKLAWLATSADRGMGDVQLTDAQPNLAVIRSDPGFPAIRARIEANAVTWDPPPNDPFFGGRAQTASEG